MCCEFSLLTEPPNNERNFTCLEREGNLNIARETALISSNMRGAISLLNVSCGVAMIKVYLWSKIQAANLLRVSLRASSAGSARTPKPLLSRAYFSRYPPSRLDEVRTAGCFSVLPQSRPRALLRM